MTDAIHYETYRNCTLCPRMCRADRTTGRGFCGCSDQLTAARAGLHHWEEPCISGIPFPSGASEAHPADDSGKLPAGNAPSSPPPAAPSSRGSGAVFFSGCTLGCVFCQNHAISQEHFGRALSAAQLSRIFLKLQDEGAYNINLVTPTHYLPHIIEALKLARPSLNIPVVYNCGGYERVETVKALDGLVDVWLPDFKYFDSDLARKFSKAADYFPVASAAISQMIRQTGPLVWENASGSQAPLLKRGVIIRHMVLPGHRQDSFKILQWISAHLNRDRFLISLLSQYTPQFHSQEHKELNRRLTSFEYNQVVDEAIRLGLAQGFMQEKSSAKEEYTPPFNLEGLEVE